MREEKAKRADALRQFHDGPAPRNDGSSIDRMRDEYQNSRQYRSPPRRGSSREKARGDIRRDRSRSRGRRSRSRGRRSRSRKRSRSRGRSPQKSSLSSQIDAAVASIPVKKKRGSMFQEAPKGFGGGGFTNASGFQAPADPSVISAPQARNYKVLRITQEQVRILLGTKGETINRLRRQSGCDIQIVHKPSDPEGNISIMGSVAVG